MKKSSILYIGFGLTVLLWALNFIALTFYLYWSISWYDIMMHFLGGLMTGVLAMWFWGLEERSVSSFLLLFASVMIVGGAWEVFEYVNDLTFSTQEYKIDTIVDLVMDGLGGIFAYWWSTSSRKS